MHLGAPFHLNFSSAPLPMVSSPFCLTLMSRQFLEHFISVVLSRCPCLRGSRFLSLKWSCLGFSLAFDHLFEFFSRFFSFSLFSEMVTCVCCQCTHQVRDWGLEHPRTGGWPLLAVMSDWQRGVD
jgi:hypothetical protein